jgi:hypothetical protein
MQGYCPSRSAVAKFRAEAVYVEFMKQWNIGVYFSLRYSLQLYYGLYPYKMVKVLLNNVDFSYNYNYFRFQEIAGALDSALTAASLVPVQNIHSGEGISLKLTLKQSVTLLESLRSCWREDILVLSCTDKFLRLSLQLLSRSVILELGNFLPVYSACMLMIDFLLLKMY